MTATGVGGLRGASAPTFTGPPEDGTPSSPRRDDVVVEGAHPGRRLLRPGWPLAAMFVPYPLWWSLGTTDLALVAFSIPMALWLLKRPRVLAPRGFGWWLLFLVWVVGGLFVLQVDAVGAASDTHSSRYLTWLYRLLLYLAATITALYVVNARRDLTLVRVSRIISALFMTTVAGGVLGVLAPYFEFRSAMELALPNAVANQSFVNHLIHPTASQIQTVLGFTSPRPSAPFAYTNTWGLIFALTLPFFVYAWLGRTAGWRRWLAPLILLVAMVPAVYSVDRGMWAAVVVMGLFMTVRALAMGRPTLMVSVLAGAGVLAVVLAASPLADIVQARFSNEGSVQGRTNLSTLAVRSVTATAPLVGLGSTRNVQGNFNTIAGGATANCPRCSPPALGTQGQLWLVVFSQGFPGLVFFLLFFGRTLLTGARLHAPAATAATCVLVAGAVTLPAYNSVGAGMVVEMVAVAVIWREVLSIEGSAALADAATYFGRMRRQLPVVLAFTALGLVSGATWQQVRGVPVTATQSVLLSNSPRFPLAIDGPMSVDTLARLVRSRAENVAVAHATGWPVSELRTRLTVTADPNTRVLNLSLTGDRTRALAGVRAASQTYLERRAQRLRHLHQAQARILQAQAASLDNQLRTVEDALTTLRRNGVDFADTQTLRRQRGELLTQVAQVNSVLSRVLGSSVTPGVQLRPVKVTAQTDVRTVALTSGLLMGFLVGAVVAAWRERRGPRLRTASDVLRLTGLPVIARVTGHRRRGLRRAQRRRSGSSAVLEPAACQGASLALDLHRVDTLVPVAADAGLTSVVDQFGETGSPRNSRPYHGAPRAAIVASDSCRAGELDAVRRDLERCGTPVAGVVLWSRREAPGTRRRSGSSRWHHGAFGGQHLHPSRRG